MGIAASQARFLQCTAKKSNIEYQGQQINQARTILANKSAATYNQMLSLKVPTPPSQADYTKIKYTATIGSTNVVLTEEVANEIKANIKKSDNIDSTYSGTTSTYNKGKDTAKIKIVVGDETKEFFFVSRTDSTDLTYFPNSVNTSTGRLSSLCLTDSALTFKTGTTDEDKQNNDAIYKNNSIAFTIKEEIDQAAYNDAYNQYKYDQYVYEKELEDINAQSSLLHQQDQTLELQLKQLDTEQSALKTELEALDKVIGDDIESDYKTFGG